MRVREEQRICFGIVWFDNEAEADAYGKEVEASGRTYNGGYFHGMSCGREKGRDYDEDGKRLYAVTN